MTNLNLWLVEIELPSQSIDNFMEGLEEFADSMSCFEDEEESNWKLLIYTQTKPDNQALESDIKRLSLESSISEPTFVIKEVEEIDWVAESQNNFESVDAGDFFVYPSWREDEIPENKISIEIDPKQAFGTGGHETTKGCLLALQELDSKVDSILDLGCGTGILAIAAAKYFKDTKIIAVDNDNICVDTSIENAKINNVSDKVKISLSEGYESTLVKDNSPYNIIIANILALPLIELAPKAKEHLAPNGYIILAGLMNEQAKDVIQSYENEGCKLVSNKTYGNWTILTMQAT